MFSDQGEMDNQKCLMDLRFQWFVLFKTPPTKKVHVQGEVILEIKNSSSTSAKIS